MSEASGLMAGRTRRTQWVTLVGLSLLLAGAAEMLHLPAALLIGPMVAAIIVAGSDGSIRMAAHPFTFAQGIIGCLIGRSIPLSVFDELAADWPLFVVGILSVIVMGSLIGYLLTRLRFLPGTTAIWGVSPGASTAMILMSEAYGADVRLVAVMQYLRVVMVIAIAALVAKLWAPAGGPPALATVWFPATDWGALAGTIVVAGGVAFLGQHLKIPAGPFLLPLAAAMTLHESHLMTIELPPWLLALSYGLIGWSIGLRFTRGVIHDAVRALPQIMASIVSLIVLCAALAGGMVVVAGIDPLTAYLAMSPGGADSIAIIAASANGVDVRFVMAMQTARLMVVLIVSPILSRWVAARTLDRGAGQGGG